MVIDKKERGEGRDDERLQHSITSKSASAEGVDRRTKLCRTNKRQKAEENIGAKYTDEMNLLTLITSTHAN